MGLIAEDFYKAFQLGTGNTSIGLQDLTGVSLAAIKELNKNTDELQQKTTEVEQLREEVINFARPIVKWNDDSQRSSS